MGASWGGQWGWGCTGESGLGNTRLRGGRTEQPEMRTSTRRRENRIRAVEGKGGEEGGDGQRAGPARAETRQD